MECLQCDYKVCASCANQDGLLNHEHQMILKNNDNSYSYDMMPESIFFSSNYSGSFKRDGLEDSYSRQPSQRFSFKSTGEPT